MISLWMSPQQNHCLSWCQKQGRLDSSFLKSSSSNADCRDGDNEKLRRYKEEVVTIINKYFLPDDVTKLVRSLEDLAVPKCYHVFLKKLITLVMDWKNREKEMASVLLSALRIELFLIGDIVKGFITLLESGEDTVLDDVFAPLNMEEISSRLPSNCSGSETVHMACSLVSARHAGERLLRRWGGVVALVGQWRM